jgi:hypothetical protein
MSKRSGPLTIESTDIESHPAAAAWRAYAAIPGAWSHADPETLRREVVLGRTFQALAATEWACASLVVASERHLIRPVSSLRQYRGHLAEALAAGAGWLA